MSAPERIWLNTAGDYASAYEATLGTETGVTWCDIPQDDDDHEYIRADIAVAQVAAAYERAAELACERLADSWTWDDADFLSDVIADLKRHLTKNTQTDALEQVRREAERDGYERGLNAGIPVAAALAAAISLLERGGKAAAPSDKMFEQMVVDYRRALNDYRALLDNPTQEDET